MAQPLEIQPQLLRESLSGERREPVAPEANALLNKLAVNDRAFHDWYRFVLSFPPHLVRDYLDKFSLNRNSAVLDPFCGTGTTVVEAQRQGMRALGLEWNPVAHLASSAKSNWSVDGDRLLSMASAIRDKADKQLSDGTQRPGLSEAQNKLLLRNSIAPLPLHKALVLRDCIQGQNAPEFRACLTLALAKTLVHSASNLHFGPEVGVRGWKEDADVLDAWFANISMMAADLRSVCDFNGPKAVVHRGDARLLNGYFAPNSIDAVFTSPPYPNEKDYTRTTRLETVVLDFVKDKAELRTLKKGLVRSNTRGVYRQDDDDTLVAGNPKIQELANEIERRRIEMNKTSGFERMYARVTKLYFGGMARHLAELRPFLKPGARLGYVVGDQASYLQVMIRTGQHIAEIAESLGYEVVGIDLFRTRFSTVTRVQMREEVVVLKWPGVH